jgi:hypothetical protein
MKSEEMNKVKVRVTVARNHWFNGVGSVLTGTGLRIVSYDNNARHLVGFVNESRLGDLMIQGVEKVTVLDLS